MRGRIIAGFFNETLRGLKLVSRKEVSEEVASDIAKAILKQIEDKNDRAFFVDYVFNNYSISI